MPAGDVPVDIVAPGGGGSGYLKTDLTATAGDPNTGTGFVSFTWTFPPPVVPAALPNTGVDVALPLLAGVLLLGVGGVLVARRGRVRA